LQKLLKKYSVFRLIITFLLSLISHSEKVAFDDSEPDSVINELVYQLYGLTEDEIRIVEGHLEPK